MSKLTKYSRLLHWLTFLCFLLPFFYTGCAGEKAPEMQGDTTSVILPDSSQIDTSKTFQATSNPEKTDTSLIEKKDETISETLSQRYTFLKPVLVSEENTFSGLAIIIDSILFIRVFGTFMCVFLLALSLATKYLELKGMKTVVLIEALSFLSLVNASPYSFNSERLWGLWVALAFVGALALLDCYILIKQLRSKKEGESI